VEKIKNKEFLRTHPLPAARLKAMRSPGTPDQQSFEDDRSLFPASAAQNWTEGVNPGGWPCEAGSCPAGQPE